MFVDAELVTVGVALDCEEPEFVAETEELEEIVVFWDGVGVDDHAVVEEDDAEVEIGGAAVHFEPPSHLKPFGQHKLPQLAILMLKSVLNNSLAGCRVAFCWVMSQLIVEIVEQSLPAGQQMADLSLLKATHLVFDGQQKLLGSPTLLHGS